MLFDVYSNLPLCLSSKTLILRGYMAMKGKEDVVANSLIT